jgi:hypothetical protein
MENFQATSPLKTALTLLFTSLTDPTLLILLLATKNTSIFSAKVAQITTPI